MSLETSTDVWKMLDEKLRTDVKLTWNRTSTVVLVIDSEKGGAGKSGLAGGLIAVMAAHGYKVLGIDLDPRGTFTEELGADPAALGVDDLLYVAPDGDPDQLPPLRGLAADAIQPAGAAWGPNVSVLSARRSLANRESDTTPGMEQRLGISLQGVVDQYALVVIDLPPRAGGKLVASGLYAATDAIFPATLETDGLVGVRDALRTFKRMSQTIPHPVRNVGVLRNIVDRRTRVGIRFDALFTDEFGDQLLPIAVPKRVIRVVSRAACVPITAAGDQGRELVQAYTHVLNAVGTEAA